VLLWRRRWSLDPFDNKIDWSSHSGWCNLEWGVEIVTMTSTTSRVTKSPNQTQSENDRLLINNKTTAGPVRNRHDPGWLSSVVRRTLGLRWQPSSGRLSLCRWGETITATVQCRRRNQRWKVGGDLSWGGLPTSFLFLFHPFPMLHPSSFNHCRFLSYSFFQLGLGKRSKLPAEMTTSRKSWRDHVQLVPTISKVGGDASHASHRAVAPRYRAVVPRSWCGLGLGLGLAKPVFLRPTSLEWLSETGSSRNVPELEDKNLWSWPWPRAAFVLTW